ncbi:uncharacterized protein LY89DRAFT_785318 [Mollisia scopiformis]|uniref:Uncharacterized protein n=1 Tax=Mollisia scopiformis TaxID=149040 RepID=A0A194WXM5_MOLSC|nr:uncharacterized protein LY89DRAFT_785318 [Mollisia scopiformis]KUJ12731.1 hypothetical protein LY89DRAFT_785318 [Mollisia scopiformis]
MDATARVALLAVVQADWDTRWQSTTFPGVWVMGTDGWPRRQREEEGDDEELLCRTSNGCHYLCVDGGPHLKIVVAEEFAEKIFGLWLAARDQGHSKRRFRAGFFRDHTGHRYDLDFIVRTIENHCPAVKKEKKEEEESGPGPCLHGVGHAPGPKRRRAAMPKKFNQPRPSSEEPLPEATRKEGWKVKGEWTQEENGEWARTLVRTVGGVEEEMLLIDENKSARTPAGVGDTRNQYWLQKSEQRRGRR